MFLICCPDSINRELNDKSRAFSDFCLEPNPSIVLLDDNRMSDGQSLACSLSDILCSEKGFENLSLVLFTNTGTGIADSNFYVAIDSGRLDTDCAFPSVP